MNESVHFGNIVVLVLVHSLSKSWNKIYISVLNMLIHISISLQINRKSVSRSIRFSIYEQWINFIIWYKHNLFPFMFCKHVSDNVWLSEEHDNRFVEIRTNSCQISTMFHHPHLKWMIWCAITVCVCVFAYLCACVCAITNRIWTGHILPFNSIFWKRNSISSA